MPNAAPVLTVSHATVRCPIRVGCTTVLEITATYPILSLSVPLADSPLSSAVERFNQAYRTMAEAFCAYGEGAPADRATEAFLAAGRSAPYTFDRRLLSCRMEAVLPETLRKESPERLSAEAFLTVRRTVSAGTRRGGVPSTQRQNEDVWRRSDLTLRAPRRESGNAPGKMSAFLARKKPSKS